MASAEVNDTINAPIEKVWALATDFVGIDKIMSGIDTCEGEGEGVGSVRRLTLNGAEGIVVERLERLDEAAHELDYSITEETTAAMPFREYLATIKLTAAGDATQVNWSSRFEPQIAEDKAVRFARGIYTAGIAGFKNALGLES
ncbi:MAG: SRPBCC family protein [Acidimicrobiales bacterium]